MNRTEKMLLVIILIMVLGLCGVWKLMKAIDYVIWRVGKPIQIELYETEPNEKNFNFPP